MHIVAARAENAGAGVVVEYADAVGSVRKGKVAELAQPASMTEAVAALAEASVAAVAVNACWCTMVPASEQR